jgi:ankyrin repeat protein
LNNLHMIYATRLHINDMHPSMCRPYSEVPSRGFVAWSLISVSRLGLIETMKWLLSFEYVRSEINTFFHPHHSGPPIVEASASGHAEIVRLLLDASANPNQYRPHDSQSALHLASGNGHAEVVRTLIDAGADVNQRDNGNGAPLWEAAYWGHVEAMQMLIDAGAKLDQGRNPALCAASVSRHPAALQHLLQCGSTTYRRRSYRSALRAAIRRRRNENIQILLDAGQAETDSKEHRAGYVLQAASLNGDKETLQQLIDSGVDVNARGGYFGSALYAATLCSRAEIVQMLLNAGADANCREGSESPVLQIATANKDAEIVLMLIAAGADVDEERGQFHGCALQIASLRGFKDIVHILLQGGADVNHFGGLYGSSLQAASTQGDNQREPVKKNYEEIIRALLANGADVNQQGGKYGSALRAALAWNNADIANLLLEAGAKRVDETDVPPSVSESGIYTWDEESESDSDDNSSDSDEL